MKRLFLPLIALLAAIGSAQQVKPEGNWLGTIDIGALKLRIVLHVAKSASGYESTVDSPDQGVTGVKTSTFSAKDNDLRFTVFGGTFEGRFSADRNAITGKFEQGGQVFPLTLNRQEKAISYSRPQDPKPPFPYTSEEVTYNNAKQNIALAGTITRPKGPGPFPAVLLITGSGAENRNEEILGHRPFLVLADYLTRRGIEVLRVDDRGVGGSTGSTPNSTTADFVTDVLAGVSFLKARPEVDSGHIGLLGHSEGGIIAPMAASESKDVAFVVMMAGTGIPGNELLPQQEAAILRASGEREAVVQQALKDEERVLRLFAIEKDPVALNSKLGQIFDEQYARMSPAERAKSPTKDVAIKSTMAQMSSPWFHFFLTLDPRDYLQKVTCPVLALNGTLDTQVPADVNLPEIKKALTKAGNTRYTIEKLPGLNHLFQDAKTGAPAEYALIDETLSPVLLKRVGDWILRVVEKH